MKKMDTIIRLECEEERRNTESLVREAFWNVYRPGALEHFVLHEFRSRPEFVSEMNYVMEVSGRVVGQVMMVHNTLTTTAGNTIPILTLGPICIHPDCQRKGYGLQLLNFILEKAAQTDAAGVFLEGNIDFYGKAGFELASSLGIHYMDEPVDDPVPYFLCKVLKREALSDIKDPYQVPQGYFIDVKAAEEFDKQFPPKEKLRLPTQLFG